MTDITSILDELPSELRQEVIDFAEFLLLRTRKRTPEIPKLDWVGALQGSDSGVTSVELQHEISRWRESET